MRSVRNVRAGKNLRLVLLALFALTGLTRPAAAQNSGFQLNRYEPTAAGEWSFSVDHPFYSKTRYFAAGLTLNYAHDPFVLGQIRFDGVYTQTQAVIAHQLTGHFDLAGSFLDRVLLSLSLPVDFLEVGEPAMMGGVAPIQNVTVSDPRLGAMVRIAGQPYSSPFSVSVGGNLWVPLGAFSDGLPQQTNDRAVRGALRAVLAGLAHRVIWSFTGGVMLRPEAELGSLLDPVGASAGSELQLGGSVGYADVLHRLALTTEMVLATALNKNIFQLYSTSLEVLFGVHYNLLGVLQIGAAGGFGALRQPGTPDGRFLFRIAYAPMKVAPPDRDKDGVPDPQDLCPLEPRGEHPDPRRPGCPARDSDGDGLLDPDDECPDQPMGAHPDAKRRGCPIGDKDGDGVLDPDDECPDSAAGPHPDPGRRGCPAGDKDGDGVVDPDDQCPETPAGQTPDPSRPGCPAGDKDGDGILDPDDQCPETPAGSVPDPKRKGCPAPDRDQDLIVDPVDACPDQPGVPSSDPKANGCPSRLLEVRSGRIILKEPLVFTNKKDVLKKPSFERLQAVADALTALTQIKKVRIQEQPEDPDAKPRKPVDPELRLARAKAVMGWLSEHEVSADRLEAQSAGPNVEFLILDPAPPTSSTTPAPGAPTPTSADDVKAAPATAAPPPAAKAQPSDAETDAPVKGKGKPRKHSRHRKK